MVKIDETILKNVTSRKREFEILRFDMENERSDFEDVWQTAGDFNAPMKIRFNVEDDNRGTRKNQHIIDSTPVFGVRTLKAGMMSGITSPSRPWLKITTPDPNMAEIGEVKKWLEIVNDRMTSVFLKSNLYQILPSVYGDAGVFATGGMIVEEDLEDVIRCHHIPMGTYAIGQDERGIINSFSRKFQRSVRQIIDKWGRDRPGGPIQWDRLSDTIATAYEGGHLEQRIEVRNVITVNNDYKPGSPLSKHKKFVSAYYEAATGTGEKFAGEEDNTFLRISGFDFFPFLGLRWDKTGNDVWGTDCPAMDVLNDNTSLQHMHRMKYQAITQKVKPSMQGPPNLRNAGPSIVPGDITYYSINDAKQGFRKVYEVNMDITELREDIIETQSRINESFYKNLFLAITELETTGRTKHEIQVRQEEKLLMLGTVLERVNDDLLDKLVDITYLLMERQGLIPEAPEALDGVSLKVEYISIMAQAQKSGALGSLERFTTYVTNLAQQTGDPSVMRRFNADGAVKTYGDAIGESTKVVRTDEEVAFLAEQDQRAAQAAAQAEQTAMAAKSANDLAGADLSSDNALTELLKQQGVEVGV